MARSLFAFVLCAGALGASGGGAAPGREDMLRAIADDARGWTAIVGGSRLSPAVMAALAAVPREEFVPPALRARAYENVPLAIGHEQTISQPSIVALMTDLLRVAPGDTVLEVGTGSGYQAAVLAQMGAVVHSIEIIPELAHDAAARLARLGYHRVTVHVGSGYDGLPSLAPFAGILVTAAPETVPPALVAQLAPRGRLVAPVGPTDDLQRLVVVEKDAQGRTTTRRSLAVRFVPLVRE